MSEISKKRINKDEIVARAQDLVAQPVVRDYTDDERKALETVTPPATPYQKFCGFLVSSWIDGSRYAETAQSDHQSVAERMLYLMAANAESRANYIDHHRTALQPDGTYLDVPQAMHDARQLFLSIGAAQEMRF